MDPHQQQINQLDPKLKEAYEKVMGTGNSPLNISKPTNTIAPPPNNPLTESNPTIIQSVSPATPFPPPNKNPVILTSSEQAIPQQAPISISSNENGWVPPNQPTIPPINTTMHTATPIPQAKNVFGAHGFVAKKKTTISPVIITLMLIVFFVVYTFFCLKLFNVKLPFLP